VNRLTRQQSESVSLKLLKKNGNATGESYI
jgi:hypothetical protein